LSVDTAGLFTWAWTILPEGPWLESSDPVVISSSVWSSLPMRARTVRAAVPERPVVAGRMSEYLWVLGVSARSAATGAAIEARRTVRESGSCTAVLRRWSSELAPTLG
jgi:hypothetical protein